PPRPPSPPPSPTRRSSDLTSTDDVEERIRLLEAGADDVMIRPIDERELDARVEALDLRHRRSKELRPSTLVAATRRPGRRLIALDRKSTRLNSSHEWISYA